MGIREGVGAFENDMEGEPVAECVAGSVLLPVGLPERVSFRIVIEAVGVCERDMENMDVDDSMGSGVIMGVGETVKRATVMVGLMLVCDTVLEAEVDVEAVKFAVAVALGVMVLGVSVAVCVCEAVPVENRETLFD